MSTQKKLIRLLEISESLVKDTADVYLLFADLVGSTEYKNTLVEEDLPDYVWIFRQLTFLGRSADIVKKYEGVVVKTIGDEIFGYFEAITDPQIIMNCGIEIIQAFENLNTFTGRNKIEVKVSIDFGSTYNGSIDKSGSFDPIGVPVDRCARLVAEATKSEIVLSNEFLEALISRSSLKKIKDKYSYQSFQKQLKGLGTIKYHKIVAQ
jgi:class 3 adenylate cyclase